MEENTNVIPMKEEDLDEVVEMLSDTVDDHIKAQREAAELVEYDPDAELESEKALISLDRAIKFNDEGLLETDMSIFDIQEGKLDELSEEMANKAAIKAATSSFDLSDEESLQLFEVMVNYRKDDKYPIYKNLPEKVRVMVRKTCVQEGLDSANYNLISKLFLDEFISEAAIDQEFVSLQKSIDEALNIPSISDLYSEHINMVMNDKLPAYAEELKEAGKNDKADMLYKIKEAYTKSYDMTGMKETYLTSARARKSVRKRYHDYNKSCDELNMINAKTKFKMDDAHNMYKALYKALITEDEENPSNITNDAIAKFVVLFCESCYNLNPEDIIDASYMYYGMKNVISLEFTDEAKTDFALQLISNIKEMIQFILDEEAKSNAVNDTVEQRKRKRSLKSRDKKLNK